jgi:hypothetical protein
VGIYDEIVALEERYGTRELENAFLMWYAAKWRRTVEEGGTDGYPNC